MYHLEICNFQIQEEDESKASSRVSIDKAAGSRISINTNGAAASPATSVRVVDNTPAGNSGAPSPAVSGRQIIRISKEEEEDDDDFGEETIGEEDDETNVDDSGDEADTSNNNSTHDSVPGSSSGNASSSASDHVGGGGGNSNSAAAGAFKNRHPSISESFSNDSDVGAASDVMKERITRK